MKNTDIQVIAGLEEIEGDDDIKLAVGWDAINTE